jgi:hypothetical protein
MENKLEKLSQETSRLRQIVIDSKTFFSGNNPNFDFLFEKYNGEAVRFNVYAGRDYQTTAMGVLDTIFGEYAKLEYFNDNEPFQNHIIVQLREELKKGKEIQGNANNWRFSLKPLRDKKDIKEILGFTADFSSNGDRYPTRENCYIIDEAESQIRYRIALNNVESELLQSGKKYEIEQFPVKPFKRR